MKTSTTKLVTKYKKVKHAASVIKQIIPFNDLYQFDINDVLSTLIGVKQK